MRFICQYRACTKYIDFLYRAHAKTTRFNSSVLKLYVVITNWLIIMKYPFLIWQRISFHFYADFYFSSITNKTITRFDRVTQQVFYKKKKLFTIASVFHLFSFVWFFVCFRSWVSMLPVYLDSTFSIITLLFLKFIQERYKVN